MRALLFLLGLLAAVPAQAQSKLLQAHAASGSAYVGPGDIQSGAKLWISCTRGYSAAYATGSNAACNIRRASDNATQDINILANGNFDVASYNTFVGTDATCTGSMVGTTMLTITACASGTIHVNDPISGAGITQPAYVTAIGTCGAGAGTCTLNAAQTFASETVTAQVAGFVPKAYDQSGANACSAAPCDAAQTTAGQQPQLLPNAGGGLPSLFFLATGTQFLLTTYTGTAQPFTVSAVAQRTANLTTGQTILGNFNGTGFDFNFSTTSTTFRMFAGSVGSMSIGASGLHAIEGTFNSASSIGYIDGTSNAVNAGTDASAHAIEIGGQSNLANCGNTSCLTGYIPETGLWLSAFSAGTDKSMCTNKSTFYSLGLTCN